MQKLYAIALYLTAVICGTAVYAQDKADSTIDALQQIPEKYISTIDKKIDKYTDRVSKKTIKTLTKLSKWEEKIKATLGKVSPESAHTLFGNDKLTFAKLLDKIKQGEAVQLEYRRKYNKYQDDVTTTMSFLKKNKEYLDSGFVKKLEATRQKIEQLNTEEDSTQALQEFIKERKKELVSTAFKHLGKSKYLSKMNKEVWYYGESIKNYKDIFSDEAKTEKLVKEVLHKVPGFTGFVQKNSMLNSLFGLPGDVAAINSGIGIQSRQSVQQMIQGRIGTEQYGALRQQISNAQGQLQQFKDNLIKSHLGAGTGEGEFPGFKPNVTKTKTFMQRLEFGSNVQFAKANSLVPTVMDLAVTVGYKLNDKSVAGIGASLKAGVGSFDRIRFSNQGASLRSFVDWKLKRQFYLTSAWEMNYLNEMAVRTTIVRLENGWQHAALAGVTKKFNIKSKWFKQTNLQFLYDFLARNQSVPVQPWNFRVGYTF